MLLVTLPEETPVNEVIETAFHLEDRAGVQLAPIVVNGVLPHPRPARGRGRRRRCGRGSTSTPAEIDALDGAAAFRRQRQELQAAQVPGWPRSCPLAQIALPLLFTTELGPAEASTRLADAMVAGVAAIDPIPAA